MKRLISLVMVMAMLLTGILFPIKAHADGATQTRVTLNYTGGTNASGNSASTFTINQGDELFLSKPTRSGYTLLGFWTQENGSGQKYIDASMENCGLAEGNGWFSSHPSMCPAEVTLYANWVKTNQTITFDKNGGGGGTSSLNVTYGQKMTNVSILPPTRTGYTFEGYFKNYLYFFPDGTWNDDDGDEEYWFGSGNITLTAKWTAQTSTVLLNKNAEDAVDGATMITPTYDSDMPPASMPRRNGYNFLGFYDTSEATGGTQYYKPDGSSARTWHKVGAQTLFARWSKHEEIVPTPCQRHEYKPTLTPATPTKDGQLVNVCSKCGDRKATVIKRPNTYNYTKSFVYDKTAKKPAVSVKDSAGKTIGNADYTVQYANNIYPGKAKITITFKGRYAGTKVLYFDIVPKGTKLKKLKGIKRGIIIRWKKQKTQTTGYEIAYSRSKKFKKVKTFSLGDSKKYSGFQLTSLGKKKRYYVKIRTYKTVAGKNYYSKWSKIKSVKTK